VLSEDESPAVAVHGPVDSDDEDHDGSDDDQSAFESLGVQDDVDQSGDADSALPHLSASTSLD
jgi:hypothetical protein